MRGGCARVRERLRLAVGAGQSPVGDLKGVQPHHVGSRLFLVGVDTFLTDAPGSGSGYLTTAMA